VLFEGLNLWRAIHILGVAAAFGALVYLFWRRGLAAYSSASS
jgi:ABC-type uncharacterized transport system permease subunit